MLIDFFFALRKSKIPVSIKELLTLLEALKKNVISTSIDEFYYLSRMTLIKDEKFFDRFDKTFGSYFSGIENLIIHNETGIIVDEFDNTQMARAIIRLLLDQNLYNKLKIKCIEHVQQFTWEKTLSNLEQIFEEALKKK